MNEPKPISPLLDGYHMGPAISDHDGVRCCPAVKENSDSKYIVKIISIPASQVQLDALLLTGAYDDPASAMDYFRELTDIVVAEAKILKKLSKLDGFLPYDDWQVEPMDNNQLGYEIYLISSYKRSLEKYLRHNTITHLGAVNLGLDLCSALAVARRAEHIYADLKPSNIFISDDKQYRIGDLGFLDMNSLKYTSLPSKYISDYTAPELKDALTTVNTTVDTYAVGMILYQLYNNGQLPEIPEDEEPILAPVNADYELAEILLKAIARNPEDRFQDPMEMGRMLVAYMQRNRVNDDPIVPPTGIVENPDAAITGEDDSLPTEADAEGVSVEEVSQEAASMLEEADELVAHEIPSPAVAPEPQTVEPPVMEETPEASSEETVPAPTAEPDPVPQEDPFASHKEMPALENYERKGGIKTAVKQKKKKGKSRFAVLLPVLLLLLAACGGFLFYNEYYLQSVDAISVEESGIGDITVVLDTQVDNSLLTVVVSDTYGNTKQASVKDNQAHFTDLTADTLYKIKVEISGFHKLDGVSSHNYTTPSQTSITSFTAKTGSEDGSVVLNFVVSGPDTDEWLLTYSTEDEEAISQTITSHTATVTGLTVGKTYTFTLEPVAELNMAGENSIEYTASAMVIAQKLRISGFDGNSITVSWNTPEGAAVDSWDVLCYNNDGFSKTLTTVENSATFSDINTEQDYTIEVLAAGMSESARTSFSSHPVILSNIQVNADDATKLVVSWDYDGAISDAGWHVLYSVDNSNTQGIVQTTENSAAIEPRIPGATYTITIVPADGSSAFSNTTTYKCSNAEIFSSSKAALYANDITDHLRVHMLKTPSNENWSYKTVGTKDYTRTFASGQKASLLLHMNKNFYTYHFDVTVMYVIRNEEGDVISELVSQTVTDWSDMWDGANYHYCELNIPKMPTEAGEYKLYLYFNNMAIAMLEFTIQ